MTIPNAAQSEGLVGVGRTRYAAGQVEHGCKGANAPRSTQITKPTKQLGIDIRQAIPAGGMSASGTSQTSQLHRLMSAFGAKPLTQSGHQTVLRLVLLQRYRQTAQAERGLKTDLSSLQLQDDAFRVL